MGSFAEDDDDLPPRGGGGTAPKSPSKANNEAAGDKNSKVRSPRTSPKTKVYHPFGGPAGYHPYQKSPHTFPKAAAANHSRRGPQTPSSAPPPPPHYLSYPPPPHGFHHFYPTYPPPPPHHHLPYPAGESFSAWASPKPYDEPYQANPGSNIKEAFRASPPRRSPPPMDGDNAATPEKLKPLNRSPFRSPPVSQSKLSKSPMMMMNMFHGSPSAIGTYGSFGMMDTPGGTLAAEFSPMGPMLHSPFNAAEFGDDERGQKASPPKLPAMSRSHSTDDDDEDDNEQIPASPFAGFMNDDFNYVPPSSSGDKPAATEGLEGVPRSPLRSEKRAAAEAAAM